jgi:hypothetical protein
VLERIVPISLNGVARYTRGNGKVSWSLTAPADDAIASGFVSTHADLTTGIL